MISCPKCDNDTRTSGLVTAQGDVMLAGTIGTDPRPILAQVCTACGYIELYAPLTLDQPEAEPGRGEHTKHRARNGYDNCVNPAMARDLLLLRQREPNGKSTHIRRNQC